MKKLSPSALAVLRVLTDDPKLAESSNATFARLTSRCVRSVCRGLDELESAELIRITYRRAYGPGDVARIIDLRPRPAAPEGGEA
jgi:predicted transcriptional regulator